VEVDVVVAFRLMTWNVQNLLPVGSTDGPPTQAAMDAKLASLAAVIDAQQPDVLALQEVGPPEVLEPLQALLGHKLPHREVSAHPDHRGIRVALLSRLPLTDPVQVHPFPAGLAPVQVGDPPAGSSAPPPTLDHMGRGALQATVTAHGHQVTVITAHLKSKLLTFPGNRHGTSDEDERARFGAYALGLRAAEAVTVRAHLTGLLHGAGTSVAVLLAGDLNDGVDAATTQLLQGPPGSELETAGFGRPDQGDGQRMWNLALRIPAKQRFSRVFRGRRELIDHVFASRVLLDPLPAVTTAAAGPAALRSVTENPRTEVGKPGSDHAAVVATFQLPG
jgi:endonuclease/exonuclease/phosphatase family metal-dependent hydrolase